MNIFHNKKLKNKKDFLHWLMFQIYQDECVNGKKNNENSVGYYSPRKK